MKKNLTPTVLFHVYYSLYDRVDYAVQINIYLKTEVS